MTYSEEKKLTACEIGLEKKQGNQRFQKNSEKAGLRNVICTFINTKMKTEFEKTGQLSKKESTCQRNKKKNPDDYMKVMEKEKFKNFKAAEGLRKETVKEGGEKHTNHWIYK